MDQLGEWAKPAIAAIATAIDPRAGFTAEDQDETGRLLTACCMAAESSAAFYSYVDEISVTLEGLRNGHGPWLEFIEHAIDRADIPDDGRAAIKAAFGMACAWLLYIERRRQHAGETSWETIATCPNGPKVWVFGGSAALPTLIEADGEFWRRRRAEGSQTAPTHWCRYTDQAPPRPPI